jgi:hypothetical protein
VNRRGAGVVRNTGFHGVIRSLLPAIVAINDVRYTLNSSCTIWLGPYRRGKPVDALAWKKILAGADLIVPTKIDRILDNSIGFRRMQAAC